MLASIYWLGFFLLMWCFCFTYTRKKRRRSKFPVAKGFPIIGSALDIMPVNVLKTAFSNPAKYGPVYEFNVAGTAGFMIGDPSVMREILAKRPKKVRRRSGNEYSSKILGISDGLFESNGAAWSQNRRATAPSFSSQNIKNKHHLIISQVKHLLDRLREYDGQVLDMKLEAFSLTIRVISAVAFGLQPQQQPADHRHPMAAASAYFVSPQFLLDTNAMFKFNGEHRLFPYPKWLWRYSRRHYQMEVDAVEAANRFTIACHQLIAYKKLELVKNKEEKLIDNNNHSMLDSLLLIDSNSNVENDDLIIANMKTFFLAGSETTSVAITWSAYVLSQYPDIAAKVRAEAASLIKGRADYEDIILTPEAIATELTYCTAVAKEVLRCYGAVPILGLEVEKVDNEAVVEVAKDLCLQAGDALWMNIEYVSHHPEAFAPDPRAFRPERWLLSLSTTSSNAEEEEQQLKKMEECFLCFGAGPRICPGINLAFHEIIPVIALLGYFFDLHLACPVSEIERVVGWTAAANKMPMTAKFRDPLE